MKKKIIMLVSTLIALVLEILPYGAVCNFANPNGKSWRYLYSYFDLTPFGYAHFSPFLTALLTCVLLVLIIASIFLRKDISKLLLIISAFATVTSLMPLCLGIHYFTILGAGISILLFFITVVTFCVCRERKKKIHDKS